MYDWCTRCWRQSFWNTTYSLRRREMKDICHFWAQICFLATPLARCPLAVVQRNGPNLSTSASRLLLAHEQHCTSIVLQSLLTSPLPDDQWGGACSYATSSGTRFQGGGDSLHLWTISCSCMIVNQGWKKVQKWETNGLINAACGNQCSFRGCELGEWLVIVVLW